MSEPLRVVSYGGGVQSTALLVLAARGVIDFRTFLMANVGDDSEDPRSLDYVRDVAMPYAKDHGIDIHLLDRVKRDGTVETLWGRIMREGSRSLPIPMRGENGMPMGRACTADFKVAVTGKWLKAHGATKDNPATIGIGISLDEIQRANVSKAAPHERLTYPLIGIGEETGLTMTRQDCIALIADEGLPVPPKSSCFFCPFHKPSTWTTLRGERPDLFAKSVQMERTINERRAERGLRQVWMTRLGAPLDEVIGEPEAMLPGLDEKAGECDSGWCWT